MNLSAIQGIHTPSVTGTGSKMQQTPAEAADGFARMLNDALDKVNQQQLESEIMTEKLATGEVQDVHQVMIAGQKAQLSLMLTIEVRNKMIEAYQEVMRMQL